MCCGMQSLDRVFQIPFKKMHLKANQLVLKMWLLEKKNDWWVGNEIAKKIRGNFWILNKNTKSFLWRIQFLTKIQ